METLSFLGFWAVRSRVPMDTNIHVYPNLIFERRHVKGLFQSRGSGVHARRILGKGREFEQLREYLPGDNYEDIYWKATAKRGEPVTRLYQVE